MKTKKLLWKWINAEFDYMLMDDETTRVEILRLEKTKHYDVYVVGINNLFFGGHNYKVCVIKGKNGPLKDLLENENKLELDYYLV